MQHTQPKILVVDDDELLCSFVQDALSSADFTTYSAVNIRDAKRLAHETPPDLLITDIQMPGGTGLDLVKFFRTEYPAVPAIVITGFPGVEYVSELEEMEVDAFLTKPFSAQQIRFSVLKGLEKRRRELEINSTCDGNTEQSDLGLSGSSPYVVQLRKKIRTLAKGDFPVLIEGPSGTGKEIIAHAIHSLSSRHAFPMVTINCAAIPKDLEESEFFGHIKGAFTGAIRDKNGIIFAADKSTLFLDEVAELSAGVQAKLLRVLENGEFLRIGETTPRTVDIRIIAATNRSLTQMVDAGAFRQDLYFRLGMTIRTVPLAEHPEDIPEIIRDLVTEIHARDARYPDRLTSEAMACLVKREWQGNVRELKQAIQVLCQTAVGKHRVNATDIEAVLDGTCASSDGEAWYSDEKSKVLQEFELDYFSRLLKKYSGNLSQAAKASGMHRPNLIKKLKCLGIEPDSYRE